MKSLLCFVCVCFVALPSLAFPTPKENVPPQCSDPTFACQDLQSARTCQVVTACIQDVWATMTVPDDNDEICDICKEMVKEARDQLLSNMTQEEIKEVFEGSCKLLPVKIIAEGCIKIVDEIIPELVEMLASRMDPNMVCTVSGMCFPTSYHGVEINIRRILKLVLIKDKDEKCDDCTKMMTDVQTFLKSESESDTKTYLEKICKEKVPSYLCDIIIKSYFHEIYTYIIGNTPAQMCQEAGVCPQTCEFKNGEPLVKDDLSCEFCENILEKIKDMIIANTTMDQFKNALLNFCKETGRFSDKCTALVNDYYDMLYVYLKDLDSKGVCSLMGLCKYSKCSQTPLVELTPAFEARRKIPKIKLQPAQPVESNNINFHPLVSVVPARTLSKKEFKESNDIFQSQLPVERFIHPFPRFEQNVDCAMCKAFSIFLETDLAGDKSKVGVRTTIENICEKWMKDYSDHCNHIVSKYSHKIQMAIAKGTTFEDLCSLIKVCPLEEDKTAVLKVRVLQGLNESLFCDLCKDTMNEVEKQLNDPATKQKLENLLGQVCNILPSSLRDNCVSFVNQNIEAVLDILQQELKPDNICPALRLCSTPRLGISPRVKDLECDVCKDVVTSFRQKLQDPAAKVMVETFLEEGCARLPQSIAAECKKFVDDNIDYLMKMIVDEMDPQKVCSILNICPASVAKIEAAPLKTSKVNDIECDLCEEVVGKLEDMLKDKTTEDEIKQALDTVCSYLPSSIAPKCQSFINQYTELLITLLTQELDPQMVCAALKLCPESLQNVEAVPLETSNVKDIECDLCKEVVGKLEDMLKDKTTEDEIKQALDTVCSYLPSSIANKCESFINQYTELLITLLTQELDPQMVCAALKVCPESLPKVEAVPLETSNIKDVECDLCKEVVGKLEDMLKDKTTEDEIKQALDKVCSYLPSSIAPKCQNFINQYTELLITLLTQELDPQMVCAALKLCPESLHSVEAAPLETSNVKDIECDLCKEVVGKLEDMLKDKTTEDEIKQALDTVCSYLPSSIAPKCQSFINQYTELLITLLTQELDPQMVCAALKLCPDSLKKVEPVPLDSFNLKDIECSLCKEVVGKLENLLKDKTTEDEIKHALDTVCSLMPSSMATKCDNFINKYTDLLVTLLAQGLEPDMVCGLIKLCPAQDLECKGCQYALSFIRQQLMNNETQGKVKSVLKKACNLLPKNYADNCVGFVDEYGDAFLELLAEQIDPAQLCFKVKMCGNQTSILKAEQDVGRLDIDECSVCTTVVDYLDKLIEEDDVDKEITQLVERVCTVLPASVQKQCTTVLETYGPYILQMIGQLADSKQICQDIDLCSRPPEQVHLIGGSKCTFGPSYWCRSQIHASSCKAESFCKEKVWKN